MLTSAHRVVQSEWPHLLRRKEEKTVKSVQTMTPGSELGMFRQ